MAFSSPFLRGLAVTNTLPKRRKRDAKTRSCAEDYLTRSVRRASGLVLVADSDLCHLRARNRQVGDAEPGHQRHCCWLRHYLSAPSPSRDQSEGAICILYIDIVLRSDLLSALPYSQP